MNEDAPIPVSVITAEDIKLSGVTSVADIVNRIPALGQPFGQFSTTAGEDRTGTSVLNLRNLGSNRTLVLVNGKRQVSSVVNSAEVDTLTIPTSLIKRVEVSTGGASVAYGADAVTGVVNFILDDRFEGVSVQGQYGGATRGGATNRYITATAGQNFANDRGNVAFSGTYEESGEVRGQDREFGRLRGGYASNPANTGPNDGIPDQILYPDTNLNFTNERGILLGALSGTQYSFTTSGQLATFDGGQDLGNGTSVGGDGYDFTNITQIQNPYKRYVLYGAASYDIAPDHHFKIDARYAQVDARTTYQNTGDFFNFLDGNGGFFTISPDNPFLPQDPRLTALFASNPAIPAAGLNGSSVLFSKFGPDTGVRQFLSNRRTVQVSIGVDGKLPLGDLSYALSYQYGWTSNDYAITNNRVSSRFARAVDAVTDVAGVVPGNRPGDPACRETVAAYTANPNGSSSPDINACRPLNLFGLGNESAASLAYIQTTLTRQQTLSQHVATFGVNGSLFRLPAGPVAVALGAQFREERSRDRPDAGYIAGDTFDGGIVPSSGRYRTFEGYVEVAAPLLKDRPFAEELSVEGGVRVSSYDSIGTTLTWRVGGTYAPVSDIRFRAGYSVAVRAPNIGELFLPATPTFFAVIDPCDASQLSLGSNPSQRQSNCQTLVGAGYRDPQIGVTRPGVTSGNRNLSEETADSFTVGATITPRWLRHLTFSADYYNIRLRNAIVQQDAQGILNGCVDSFSTTNNSFCSLIRRAPNGQISNINVTVLNVARIATSGVDFAANLQLPLAELGWNQTGSLSFNLNGTRLLDLTTVSGIGATGLQTAGAVDVPLWRINWTTTLNVSRFTAAWTTRWSTNGRLFAGESAEARFPSALAGGDFHDVQLRYAVIKQADLYVGMNNVFDRQPYAGSTRFTLLSPDVLGRVVYGGFALKF